LRRSSRCTADTSGLAFGAVTAAAPAGAGAVGGGRNSSRSLVVCAGSCAGVIAAGTPAGFGWFTTGSGRR